MGWKRFVVKESACTPSARCWGKYIRVAVLEMEPGFKGQPSMISERAKGVVRIVELWDKQHLGKTERSAGHRARREAEELANVMNCPLERMVIAVDGWDVE